MKQSGRNIFSNLLLSPLELRDDEGEDSPGILRSEKGIALVMVLVLSFICLAITAALIYLVTQGTKFSGFNKRYETAREAGYGGSEVSRMLVGNQGSMTALMQGILVAKSMTTIPVDTFSECDCGNTTDPDNITPAPDSCLCKKLCSPTLKSTGAYNWPECENPMLIDPTSGSYDLKFQLNGFGTNYNVFTKIVDTSIGNTDLSGLNLGGTAVVASGSGTIAPPADPYLYTIEITAQDQNYATTGPKERGRLSVLYAY